MDRYGSIVWERGMQDPVYVRQLQKDLKELGFSLVGDADGLFGGQTFWALREFQAYAGYETVGRSIKSSGPVFDRLEPVATGVHRYTGLIDGVANDATRALLEHWLDSNWRCPVVINAWNLDSAMTKKSLEKQNVWLHGDLPVSTKTIGYFAHDLSGAFGPEGVLPDGTALIGQYVRYKGYGGPRSEPPDFTDENSEILPENLIGRPWAQLSATEKTTFRVVRAVSEVECIGFFDAINAYDGAYVSIGPCHWTLGLTKSGQIYDGELCATLGYGAHKVSAEFNRYVGRFGIRVDRDWLDSGGKPNGGRFYDSSLRKYTGWLSSAQRDGEFVSWQRGVADGDYFRSWHWIYRLTAAMRGSAGLRASFWDMARVRLRDLGAMTVSVAGTNRSLSAVFTSEKARAFIQRWHIYRPADISSGGAGSKVREFVQRATAKSVAGGWTGNPSGWTDAHERHLVQAILDSITNKELRKTIGYVDRWPDWKTGSNPRNYRLADGLAALSAKRQSFTLDTAGLPPPP